MNSSVLRAPARAAVAKVLHAPLTERRQHGVVKLARLRLGGGRRRLGVRLGTAGRRRVAWTPCVARSRSASTGSTPPRSTGSATPRRWWAACLRDLPPAERPYVFTKCGLVWDERDRMAAPVQTLAPDSIRREAEASLRRLGVERIDLYQFHWPDAVGTPVEESWAAMARLVEEGKVRAAGRDQLRRRPARALRGDPPRGLAAAAVLAHPARGRQGRELPWCAEHGTGVIATARCSPAC